MAKRNLKSYLPNSEDSMAEFVWDIARRRLLTANAPGLRFWGENDIVDLRTRTFSPSDPNVVALNSCADATGQTVRIALKPHTRHIFISARVDVAHLAGGRHGIKFSFSPDIDETLPVQYDFSAYSVSILEHSPHPVILIDTSGNIVAANAAARDALVPEQSSLIHFSTVDNITPEQQESLLCWLNDNNDETSTNPIAECVRDGQATCSASLPGQFGECDYRLHLHLASPEIIAVTLSDLSDYKMLLAANSANTIEHPTPDEDLVPDSDSDNESHQANESVYPESVKTINTGTAPDDIARAVRQLASRIDGVADNSDEYDLTAEHDSDTAHDTNEDKTTPSVEENSTEEQIASQDCSDNILSPQPDTSTVSEYLSNILSVIGEACAEIDRNGQVIWCDHRWHTRFGLNISTHNDESFVAAFTPEDQSNVSYAIDTVWSEEKTIETKPQPGDYLTKRVSCDTWLQRNKYTVTVELLALRLTVPEHDKTENHRVFIIARDVSRINEEKTTSPPAHENSETKSDNSTIDYREFIARISHEIRTPLSAVVGFADFMTRELFGPLGDPRYNGYATDIKAAGDYILSLVNDLLDLSRLEHGARTMLIVQVSLPDIIEQVIRMIRLQADKKQITMHHSFSAELPSVMADRRSIRQIIVNLITNAIKYAPEGGSVNISAVSGIDGDVSVRVRNNGAGMTESEIQLAFQPYCRLAAAEESTQSGVGLGLALAKALAEANEAILSLESTPENGVLAALHFPPHIVCDS